MYQIRINNTKEIIELTASDEFVVTGLDGVNPSPANVNITKFADGDGGLYENTTRESKLIVITLSITKNIETNKAMLNKFFAIDKEYTVTFTKNNNWNVVGEVWMISGHIQSIEYPTISQGLSIFKYQIAIMCPLPYFSSYIPYVAAPYGDTPSVTLKNQGDIPCGVIVRATLSDSCQYIGISLEGEGGVHLVGTFNKGDNIEIDTRQGRKTIKKNGVVDFSIAQSLEFFQLQPGDNIISMIFSSGAPSNVLFYVYSLKRGL